MRPAAIRSSNSGPRPARNSTVRRSISPVSPSSRTLPRNRRTWAKLSLQRRRMASRPPSAEICGPRRALAWNAATCRAMRRTWSATGTPARTNVDSRRAAGIRRMTTRCSHSAPSGPPTSATPRYTSGAIRRLSSTSRWHTACRFCRVLKSRKPRFTGFLSLYARSPTRNTTAACVSYVATNGSSPAWGTSSRTEDTSHLARDPLRPASPTETFRRQAAKSCLAGTFDPPGGTRPAQRDRGHLVLRAAGDRVRGVGGERVGRRLGEMEGGEHLAGCHGVGQADRDDDGRAAAGHLDEVAVGEPQPGGVVRVEIERLRGEELGVERTAGHRAAVVVHQPPPGDQDVGECGVGPFARR